MKSIIAGKGQIGTALGKILEQYKPEFTDPAFGLHAQSVHCDILHITFPYTPEFIEQVEEYKSLYTPKYIVIHSTVPVGTSRALEAVHSPVIGIHPFLESGIRTFKKMLGGEQASEVADYFKSAGLRVILFDDQETTELLKILDTSFYGICIEFTKDVKRLCEENEVPFEAWSVYTNNYNEGYQKLGYPEYTRPNLQPIMKKIGGHCILPNADMLETKFTKILKELNK